MWAENKGQNSFALISLTAGNRRALYDQTRSMPNGSAACAAKHAAAAAAREWNKKTVARHLMFIAHNDSATIVKAIDNRERLGKI